VTPGIVASSCKLLSSEGVNSYVFDYIALGWTPSPETVYCSYTLQGKELRVRRKKQVNKYPTAFRKMALERLKSCKNATELAAELGIHRTQLYKWRDQMEPVEDGPGPAANSGERELRKEIRELKWARKFWKGIFSKVPCKKSRLDAGATAALARRRLRPNPGADADARQPEYRANVSDGPSQPCRLLSVPDRAEAGGRRHGSTVGDSADRTGASAPLWLPADRPDASPPWNGGEPQASGKDYARGSSAGDPAEGLCCDYGFRSRAGGLSQHRRRVYFTTSALLVQDLLVAKRDLKLSRFFKRLAYFEGLIIDDLGYVQQSREEMEVLFTLLAERYERGSVMISSNLPFSKWEGIFKDPMTTAAAIDRLAPLRDPGAEHPQLPGRAS